LISKQLANLANSADVLLPAGSRGNGVQQKALYLVRALQVTWKLGMDASSGSKSDAQHCVLMCGTVKHSARQAGDHLLCVTAAAAGGCVGLGLWCTQLLSCMCLLVCAGRATQSCDGDWLCWQQRCYVLSVPAGLHCAAGRSTQ
jgi:hypothetical protein